MLFLLDVSLFLFLFLAHQPSPLLPVAYAQLLPIINEGGGIDPTKTPIYIVHVEKPPRSAGARKRFLRFRELKSWYMSFLPNATLLSGERRMVYAYREVISGFAARLTPEEVEVMEDTQGFITAYPEQEHRASTTYTPTFLGLTGQTSNTLWHDSSMGAGQIIGVIDTGIYLSHPSFKDDGMTPPPTKWSGKCFWNNTRTCNKKLIGAVGFRNGAYADPIDNDGHGSHVASTAAGNFVKNANVIGQATGNASGIAPRAHIAVYKVLFIDETGKSVGTDSDILAGIDQAIRDKVDILQMSIVAPHFSLYENSIAISSFAAVTRGIVPCAAAGNGGPISSYISNDAPWILSVGASTTDRRIMASVVLGDNTELRGESAYQPSNFDDAQLPMAFPYQQLGTEDSMGCQKAALRELDLRGKIVICYTDYYINDGVRGRNVKEAGGAAMVVLNQLYDGGSTDAYAHVIPAAHINYTGSQILTIYYNNSANPTAAIKFEGTQFGISPAPSVWAFSGRGPSGNNGGIIKPDVIAPGVNILAAWSRPIGPTGSLFNFLSGTSMATPHVSGVVALLRSRYPSWSPAAIKSAIMTTAYTLDCDGNPITDESDGSSATVFVKGAGHVDPEAAANPGLVYDLNYNDYVQYLCGYYESDEEVQAIAPGAPHCSEDQRMPAWQLNYPFLGVEINRKKTAQVTVKRTVTNVGDADSVYKVQLDKEPEGVKVDVKPDTLRFSESGEVLSYEVTFTLKAEGQALSASEYKYGSLRWESEKYLVRSPIALNIFSLDGGATNES